MSLGVLSFEPGSQSIHLRLSLLQGNLSFKATNHSMPTFSACLQIFWIDNQRQPQLGAFIRIIESGRIGIKTLVWETKTGRHDSNHREGGATESRVGIDPDIFSNNIRDAAKTMLPQGMAQNDDPLIPRVFFLRQEGTAQSR